ncbi:hypothetical protein ACTFIV_003363 [Dictyostelium citrinum]
MASKSNSGIICSNKIGVDVEEIEQLFFKGKSFCLDFPTSLSPTKKSQYTQFIKKNGGKIDFSITSKTNYYITHLSNIESQSLRTKNALKLNIGILLDTFIYNCFDNKINSSSDFINYLYINGIPANQTINENVIENSISETYFILNNILSTFKQPTTSSISSININNNNNGNYDRNDDNEEDYESDYSESESSYGLDMFSINSDSNYRPYIPKSLPTITTTTTTTPPIKSTSFNTTPSTNIFSPTSLISTTTTTTTTSSIFSSKLFTPSSLISATSTPVNLTNNLFESITNDLTNKSNKPLSKFEILLLQKKEDNEKKKMEIQKVEDEKKRIKEEQLELKKKERQEKLEQSQKEKQIKIEAEKERRKLVLEKTKSTLSTDQLIKLKKSNITINNNTNTNNNNNNNSNGNNKKTNGKLKSTSFSLQIDHEGIRIKKEQEKQDRLNRIEIEKETKRREKEERTKLFHDNKNELERIENEEKIRKQKESLDAFLKRQEKRLAKEKKEQKEREEAKQQNSIGTTIEPPTVVITTKEPEVDEDLRKLFVGGINCDDITDTKILRDSKKLEKIRNRRIQSLLKLFDKFGQVQKRTINSSKGLFFITYRDIESCTKALEFYSIKENRKLAIDEITKLPKKSPLYNPNKKFYVKIVKSNEKAKKKQFFEKQKIENLKITAKSELQKEEDAEFADWDIAK